MIRLLCILLLLANVAYFGWELNSSLTGAGNPSSAHATPAPDVGEVKLLSEVGILPPARPTTEPPPESAVAEAGEQPAAADGAQAETEAAPAAATQEPSTGAQAPAGESTTPQPAAASPETVIALREETPPTAVAEQPPPAATPGDVCLKVGPLEAAENARVLKQWLEDRRSWVRMREEQQPSRRLFWVYLEPTGSDAEAERRYQELKEKGIKDTLLIKRGDLKNAISLGVFSSQDSVNRRLAEVKQEGFQPLVVPRYDMKKEYWLDVNLGDATPFSEAEFAKLNPGETKVGRVPCDTLATANAAQ